MKNKAHPDICSFRSIESVPVSFIIVPIFARKEAPINLKAIIVFLMLTISAHAINAQCVIPDIIRAGFNKYSVKGIQAAFEKWRIDSNAAIIEAFRKSETQGGKYDNFEILSVQCPIKRVMRILVVVNFESDLLYLRFDLLKVYEKWVTQTIASVDLEYVQRYLQGLKTQEDLESLISMKERELNALTSINATLNSLSNHSQTLNDKIDTVISIRKELIPILTKGK